MSERFAMILCGGSGTRLWPLSRTQRPKQLLSLNGNKTLLQQTAERLNQHVKSEHLFVVTHEDHRFEVKGQLADIFPESLLNVLAEPQARNTLPAIAWGVREIWQKQANAIIGVFPSDHAIDDTDSFLNAWQTAEIAAEAGYLTLLGISPTEPSTGYGYIQPAEQLDLESDQLNVFDVARFVEKPDKQNAEKFVAKGYLWNSGMFVFRADVFMQMLLQYQSEIYEQIMAISPEGLVEQYAELPNLSIDYGLAEKADKVAVVPVDMRWSDLGSWDSIYEKHQKNTENNVTHGDVVTHDTSESLIWSTHGLVATLGIDNLAIIQTADATLICDRARTEDIKQFVTNVHESYPEFTSLHTTVHRPWGTYTILEEGSNFKIKRIEVKVGAKLSMQMHQHRSEHWVVVSGTAKITNGEQIKTLEQNQSTYIPKTHRHRLENAGDIPLQIIEVQCGDYVGEDDIVRFDDTYGRQTQ